MSDEATINCIDAEADDRSYFLHRAQWHESRAAIAEDSSTRTLHLKFARIYKDRSLS